MPVDAVPEMQADAVPPALSAIGRNAVTVPAAVVEMIWIEPIEDVRYACCPTAHLRMSIA